MQNAILSQNINFVFVYSNMDDIMKPWIKKNHAWQLKMTFTKKIYIFTEYAPRSYIYFGGSV